MNKLLIEKISKFQNFKFNFLGQKMDIIYCSDSECI